MTGMDESPTGAATDAGVPEPRRLEPDELHCCRRCGREACRCPSLEDAPYGSLPGEPGYVP
ncbi:hypothetical protein QQG74_09815 [Micromonospora sp. FIMYZ51]|uniref:hypothetical protein n=1 Tax=Micromonospora sp. FIMYZ51 TaxID=3051832 RepID=UPI00311D595D